MILDPARDCTINLYSRLSKISHTYGAQGEPLVISINAVSTVPVLAPQFKHYSAGMSI